MPVPKNMWECPKCGDYVDNYHKTCPRCNKSKAAPIYSYNKPAASTVSQPTEQYIIEPERANKSWASSFMKGIAIFLWIGGLIVAISISNVEVEGYYYTRSEFSWGTFFSTFLTYLVIGGFAFCLAELFQNVQRIADSLERMKVTKK